MMMDVWDLIINDTYLIFYKSFLLSREAGELVDLTQDTVPTRHVNT